MVDKFAVLGIEQTDIDNTGVVGQVLQKTASNIMSYSDRLVVEPRIGVHDTTHSPLALFQFDGDLTDSSGNAVAIQDGVGTTAFTEMAPGVTGLQLDGVSRISGTLDGTGGSTLDVVGDLTVECLFQSEGPVTAGGVGVIAQFAGDDADETSAHNALWQMAIEAGQVLGYFHEHTGGVDQNAPATEGPSLSEIHHLAFVRESNVVRLYIDGVKVLTSGTLTAPDGGASGRLYVGAGATGGAAVGTAGTKFIKGAIASLKIIGSALTDAQVLAEANLTKFASAPTIAAEYQYLDGIDGPIAYWQFDDSADTLTDRTGNGFDLSNDTPTDGRVAHADGPPGFRGFYFNGLTRMQAPGTAGGEDARILGDMTLAFQITPETHGAQDEHGTSPDVAGTVMSCSGDIAGGTSEHRIWEIQLMNGENTAGKAGFIRWLQENGGGVELAEIAGAGFIPGQPQLFHVKRVSNVITVYLNGVQLGDASAALGAPTDGSAATIFLGSEWNTGAGGAGTDDYLRCFVGVMHSAAIYDKVLTDLEILNQARRAGHTNFRTLASAASALQSTSGDVDISGGAAPTVNQVLAGDGAGDADWSHPIPGNLAEDVTGTYNADAGDRTITADTSGGAVTVNLPTVATLGTGVWVLIADGASNAGTNNITIAASGGDSLPAGVSPISVNDDFRWLVSVTGGWLNVT